MCNSGALLSLVDEPPEGLRSAASLSEYTAGSVRPRRRLDLVEGRTFTARDFAELPNGVCRIAALLTHELALAPPHWREYLRPIAARLAQMFRESLTNGCAPTLKEIAKATGLSLAACSRIRASARTPHPRHWQALKQLLEGERR
jgi:hypothetical protein